VNVSGIRDALHDRKVARLERVVDEQRRLAAELPHGSREQQRAAAKVVVLGLELAGLRER
jgi:hypothetical protein